MRRLTVLLGAAVAAAAVAGCSAGTSDSAALCDAVAAQRLQLRRPHLSDVIPVERSVVEAQFREDRAATARVIEASRDRDLAGTLETEAAVQQTIDETIVAWWGTDGSELLAEADEWGGPLGAYVASFVITSDDTPSSWSEFLALRTKNRQALSLLCDERPAGWVAVTDLPPATVPDDLRYVASTQTPEEFQLFLGSAQTRVAPFPSPAPERQFVGAQVSPDGQRLLAMGFGADTFNAAFVGRLDALDEMQQINPDDTAVTCLAWSPDSTSVTASRTVGPGRWKLSATDVETGQITDILGAEFATHDSPCGILTDDDTLLLTDSHPETGRSAIWKQDVKSGERTEFISIDGCNTVLPQVRPGTNDVAVIAGCENRYDQGLWVRDGDSGELRHVLAGPIAAPAWSPDGEWLLFGYQEDPDALLELWIATADGSAATKLLLTAATWPTWIPRDAVCDLCPD